MDKTIIFHPEWITALNNSRFGGIVLDDDYEEGVASSIAHRMTMDSNSKVATMGLPHKSAGFSPTVDNLPPNVDQMFERSK